MYLCKLISSVLRRFLYMHVCKEGVLGLWLKIGTYMPIHIGESLCNFEVEDH